MLTKGGKGRPSAVAADCLAALLTTTNCLAVGGAASTAKAEVAVTQAATSASFLLHLASSCKLSACSYSRELSNCYRLLPCALKQFSDAPACCSISVNLMSSLSDWLHLVSSCIRLRAAWCSSTDTPAIHTHRHVQSSHHQSAVHNIHTNTDHNSQINTIDTQNSNNMAALKNELSYALCILALKSSAKLSSAFM
eukprot:jgi/Chlat1/169/Chrsp1S03246